MSKTTAPKVSIIIPAYNTGAYLGKCIQSILYQTLSDWELFIVDDGSEDDTYETALRFSGMDDRINVIHTGNRGVSSARNTCLELISGEYYCFIDSDDTVEPQYLETLVRTAEDNSADIAQCSFRFINENGTESPDPYKNPRVYSDNAEIIRAFFEGPVGYIRVSIWSKLFRREKFQNIRFAPDLKVYEDALYIYSCCRIADKIACDERMLYNYYQRDDSAMHSRLPEIYKDYFTVFEKQYDDFKDDSKIRRMIIRRNAENSLWLLGIMIAEGKEQELWDIRKAALRRSPALLFSNAPFKLKLKVTGLALMPHLYFSMLRKKAVSDYEKV